MFDEAKIESIISVLKQILVNRELFPVNSPFGLMNIKKHLTKILTQQKPNLIPATSGYCCSLTSESLSRNNPLATNVVL